MTTAPAPAVSVPADDLEAVLTWAVAASYSALAPDLGDDVAASVKRLRFRLDSERRRRASLPDPGANAVARSADAASTSRAAAAAAYPKSGSKRLALLDHIEQAGWFGRTDDECALDFGANPARLAALRLQLSDAGWVEPVPWDSARARRGEGRGVYRGHEVATRPTRTGVPATVWRRSDRPRPSGSNHNQEEATAP